MCYDAKSCREAYIDYYDSSDLLSKYTEIFLEKANQGYINTVIRNPNKIAEIEEIKENLQKLGFYVISTGHGVLIDWSGDYNV